MNFDCFDPVGARKYHDTGLAMVTNRLETNIPHFAVTRTVRGLEEDKSEDQGIVSPQLNYPFVELEGILENKFGEDIQR